MAKLLLNVTLTTSAPVLSIDPGSVAPGPRLFQLVVEDSTGNKSAPARVVVQVLPN